MSVFTICVIIVIIVDYFVFLLLIYFYAFPMTFPSTWSLCTVLKPHQKRAYVSLAKSLNHKSYYYNQLNRKYLTLVDR